MKICPHHREVLRTLLARAGVPSEDAYFQCEALIYMNALAKDATLAGSPPTVCPLDSLPIDLSVEWQKNAVLSIAHERRPQ